MYPQNTPDRDDRGRTANPASTSRRSARVSSASNRRQSRQTVGSIDLGQQQQQVRQLPRHNPVPGWLKSLLAAQRASLILFCSVLGLSSIVYGYTVYTQDAWKSQHGQLRRLQKQERQQGVMNENLKHQMAKDAEEAKSGLVSPSPDLIVVVPKPPQRLVKSLATPAPSPAPTPSAKPSLGY